MDETPNGAAELWLDEHHRDFLRVGYRVRRTLFSERSEFQQVDVVETAGFGRMLFNDGLAMVSERDEFVYHEMIAHVPLFVHPAPKRVLVIGGGDGGTVREVLRHRSVEYCRLVEIDEAVVRASREHLPQMSSALDDPRVEVAVEDGVRYVERTDDRYDVVLVDSTDPIGPATPLFGPAFYANVRRVIGDEGIVVSQAESPFLERSAQQALVDVLAGAFDRVHVYNYSNLTYPGGLWSFSYATAADRCPVGAFDDDRVRAAALDTNWYRPAVHRAAFALPAFQARELAGRLTPIDALSDD